MRNRRFTAAMIFAVVGAVMLPALPAAADTAGVIAFARGKATVQCPVDAAGNTGLAVPGAGVNKNKKCAFSFSTSNAHSVVAPACAGVGVSDPLKKGNKKPPQAGQCSISAMGTLGPRFKSPANIGPLPNPICNALGKPKAADGTCTIAKQQQFGGPWCGASQGEDGSGQIIIGTKTITFNRLRFQSQGTLIVVTASGFKPGIGKPGQAGPVVAVVHAFSDLEKIAPPPVGDPQPNSSCLANSKNFAVDGIAAGLLLGVK